MGNEVGLDQSHGDNYQDGLEEEGSEEGAATQSAHVPHDVGEDHGTGEEEDDRDKRFKPAPGLAGGLVGRTKTEEDGVSCSRRISIGRWVSGLAVTHTRLHAQEARPGIVGAAITKTGQEAEKQTNQVRMSRVHVLHPAPRESGLLRLVRGRTSLKIGLSDFLHIYEKCADQFQSPDSRI